MATFSGFPQDDLNFSADDVGRALAGLIRRDTAGLPVPGMLGDGPKVTAVAASWRVQVSPFAFVQRIAQAINISGVSTDEQKDITPATAIPAGQARIDLIVWNPDGPALVVIPGTVAAAPVPPSNGGFEPVATVRVNSGDGNVIQGQIQPVFERTGLAGAGGAVGGIVPTREVRAHDIVTVPVVFPIGSFTVPPNLQITHFGTGTNVRETGAAFTGLTKDGFTLVLTSGSSIARQFGASWRAEQL